MNPKQLAVQKRLLEVAEPCAARLGLEIVELIFVDAKKRPTVRVLIDKDGGVTLDDCANMSRAFGDALETNEIAPGPYNLEVSSPGAERPFSSLKQYHRSLNKKIEVVLQAPIEKIDHLKGTLVEVGEDRIVVQTEKGRSFEVPLAQIKRANRVVTF